MATCPKCGVKLKITDWRPNCPQCGVNLVYYGMEERLLADADKAESEHALFQKKIDRLKASFIGSPLTIARIVFAVLPIAAFFLPLAKVVIEAPYISENTTVNALTIYNALSSMDFGALFTFFNSEILGSAFKLYFASIVLILVALLSAFVGLILLMLSCSPKGLARNYTLSTIGLFSTLASGLCFSKFSAAISAAFPYVIPRAESQSAFTGNVSFGLYILALTFAALLIINAVIAIKGVNVKYKQVYVGGLRSEEYFELVEAGTELSVIRAKMAEAQAAAEAEAAEAAAKKLAAAVEKEKEETEKEEASV